MDLFISAGAINYIHSAGHYTEEGNRHVADTLYNQLIEIPEISARLNNKTYMDQSE
jgi:hypothetical protein